MKFPHRYSGHYALAALVLLIIEICIGLFVHDAFVRPYLGDVLVVIWIYFFLRIFLAKPYAWLPWSIFAFACTVEVGQACHLADLLGLQDYPLARIIIGTSFSWGDLLCYAAGCLPLFFIKR